MTSGVVDRPEQNAFTLDIGGDTALAAYRREGDTLVFVHTEVPEGHEGEGAGTRLIAEALDQVRERGQRIVPLCSFVRHYVDQHPEVQDLVAQ